MSTSRSQAEPPLDEAVRFERLLADLSSRFVNLPPSEADQQIEHKVAGVVDVEPARSSQPGEAAPSRKR